MITNEKGMGICTLQANLSTTVPEKRETTPNIYVVCNTTHVWGKSSVFCYVIHVNVSSILSRFEKSQEQKFIAYFYYSLLHLRKQSYKNNKH